MEKVVTTSKRDFYLVFLILLTFFVISFLTNVIGPLIPDLIRDFHISLTMAAVLPFAFFIAYGVMSIPAGLLIERYSGKKMMLWAFLMALTGALFLAMYPSYITAIASLFLIGCGMAMLQVVINPLLRVSGGEEHYAFNSVLAQLIFGLASFISPLVYSYIVSHYNNDGLSHEENPLLSFLFSLVPNGLPWISLYWIFAGLCIIMIVVIGCSRFKKVELKKEEKAGSLKIHFSLLKKPTVILFFISLFCYEGTEQGVANWISQFLHEYHGYDPQTVGARTVSYFWGLMTAGGLLGLVLLKLIDSRKVLITFSSFAILSLSIGLFGNGEVAKIAFPMVGFFASVMYPIIFSLALNSLTSEHGAFSGILLTGVTGAAVFPLIIGWIGDNWGLKTGMMVLYVTLCVVLMVGFWARPIINNKVVRRNS